MTEIAKMLEEIKQPPITIHPEGYDFAACCLNCLSRNKCSLGEFGDFGVCKGYGYDRSSGK